MRSALCEARTLAPREDASGDADVVRLELDEMASDATEERDLPPDVAQAIRATAEHLDELDPHALLGTEQHADWSEIERAYRERLATYHPNRWSGYRLRELRPSMHRVVERMSCAFALLADKAARDGLLPGEVEEPVDRPTHPTERTLAECGLTTERPTFPSPVVPAARPNVRHERAVERPRVLDWSVVEPSLPAVAAPAGEDAGVGDELLVSLARRRRARGLVLAVLLLGVGFLLLVGGRAIARPSASATGATTAATTSTATTGLAPTDDSTTTTTLATTTVATTTADTVGQSGTPTATTKAGGPSWTKKGAGTGAPAKKTTAPTDTGVVQPKAQTTYDPEGI